MFVLNGIVYAGEPTADITVTAVKPLEDMMLLVTFSTGEQRLFDASVLTGPAFEALKDNAVFEACRIVDGIVTWDNEEIDCAPEFMYQNSFSYPGYKSVI